VQCNCLWKAGVASRRANSSFLAGWSRFCKKRQAACKIDHEIDGNLMHRPIRLVLRSKRRCEGDSLEACPRYSVLSESPLPLLVVRGGEAAGTHPGNEGDGQE